MVIAISGYAGSGKDALADSLMSKNMMYIVKKYAFAEALKDTVSVLFDIPLNYFHDRHLKDEPLLHLPIKNLDSFSAHVNTFMNDEFKLIDKRPYHTPRSLAILVGSTMRSADPNIWVKKTIKQIGNTQEKIAIITDLRYRSELNALKEQYGKELITVRINRFESKSKDASERDLDNTKFDITLSNDGTLGELVDKCIEELHIFGRSL